jgi:hypothetical protein
MGGTDGRGPDFLQDDPALADFNNPEGAGVHFEPPPPLGGMAPAALVGAEAATVHGRSSQPPLWESAGSFPTAQRLRVWRSVNGTPALAGEIGASCTHQEFIQTFFDSMPEPGERMTTFTCRPITAQGRELGKEFTLTFLSNNIDLQAERTRRKALESAEGPETRLYDGPGSGGSDAFDAVQDLFQSVMDTKEQALAQAQAELQEQRRRLAEEAEAQVKQRLQVADSAAQVAREMSHSMVQSEQERSRAMVEAARTDGERTQTMLTQLFQQQMALHQAASQRQLEEEARRRAQDEQRAQARLAEEEARRRRDRQEADERLKREQLRLEHEREREERRREREEREALARIDREREYQRQQRDLEERRREDEQRRREEALRLERERFEADQRRREDEARRREDEARRRFEADRDRLQAEAERQREHDQRMVQVAKMEHEAALARAEREEKERERKFLAQLEQQRLLQQQDREHQARLAQLQARQSLGGLGSLAETLGLDTPEILAKVFSSEGEGKGGGWLQALPDVLSAVGEAVQRARQNQGPPSAPAPPRPAVLPGAVGSAPRPTPTPEAQPVRPPWTPPVTAPQPRPAPQSAKPQPASSPPPKPPQPPPPSPAPTSPGKPRKDALSEADRKNYARAGQVNVRERARAGGLKAAQVNKARGAVRRLVAAYRKKPGDKEALVRAFQAEVLKTPEILGYFSVVGVSAGVVGARATAEELAWILQVLGEDENFPRDEFPLTEQDFAKKVGGTA